MQSKRAGARLTPQPKSNLNDDIRHAYSMREVAHAIGLSERSVWAMIASGRLRAVRLGRSVRIPREALAELLGGGA